MAVKYFKKGIKTSKREQRELSKIVKDILDEIENGHMSPLEDFTFL